MRFASKLIFGAVAFLSGCSTLPHRPRLELDGTTIAYAGAGDASVTVVFQSGLGDGMSVWAPVIRRLPASISTFAYDRPGYGGSDSKAGDRDPCTIAMELRETLRAANRMPPYVLVGHSIGGLYQYAFAKLHQDEVVGVLLIDPTHPDQWATVQRRDEKTAKMMLRLRGIAFSETEKREFDAQVDCLTDLKTRTAPPIPAKLLVRGKPQFGESAEFRALSAELAEQWPKLMAGLVASKVEDAGHYIQKDRPELVADEILSLVEAAREKAPTR